MTIPFPYLEGTLVTTCPRRGWHLARQETEVEAAQRHVAGHREGQGLTGAATGAAPQRRARGLGAETPPGS